MFFFNKKTIYTTSEIEKKAAVCEVLKENKIDYYLKTKYNKGQARRIEREYERDKLTMGAMGQVSYLFKISVKKEDFLRACEVMDQIRYRL